MKDIYSLIAEIDKKIKEEKLFFSFDSRQNSFNFQDKESDNYRSYSPFSVDTKDLSKVIKILLAPPDSELKNSKFTRHSNKSEPSVNWVNFNNENFLLIKDSYIKYQIGKNFLHTGIYLMTSFLSEKGNFVLATYSYSLEPQIFEMKINGLGKIEKNKLSKTFFSSIAYSGIKSIGINKDIQNIVFELPFNLLDYNGRQLRKFLSENQDLVVNEDGNTVEIKTQLKSQFCWDKTLTCIEKLSTTYFNDTDMNVLRRADLVAYLIQNVKEIEQQLPILEETKKNKILSIFEKNKDYFNLFTQSIDLNQNKFYKKIPKEKTFYDDYGAEIINSLNNFLKLQIMLKEGKVERVLAKRNKI